MHETKSRLLYILLYLWQNTDAEHYATTGDILTYLKETVFPVTEKQYRATLRSSVTLVLYIEEVKKP